MYFQINQNLAAIVLSSFLLLGCQPKSKQEQNVERLQPKSVNVNFKYKESCDVEGCTQYQLKTLQTGENWLDDYFSQRIQRTEPNAFNQSVQPNLSAQVKKIKHQRRMKVAFVGQWGKLASFSIESQYETQNKYQGMYFKEYVNFDLIQKKRISIDDLLKPNQEKKLLKLLYQQHESRLKKYQVTVEKFKLTDNFYYQKQGIVFVYPATDFNVKQKAMLEFELAYADVKALIKPQYFPTIL